VLTPAKTACRIRRAFAECKKVREIPLWLFWKNSTKTRKRPKNKRFSRRLKNAEIVDREEGNRAWLKRWGDSCTVTPGNSGKQG
jgi:hypothetical protein